MFGGVLVRGMVPSWAIAAESGSAVLSVPVSLPRGEEVEATPVARVALLPAEVSSRPTTASLSDRLLNPWMKMPSRPVPPANPVFRRRPLRTEEDLIRQV
jgi:hypothetical protein